MSMNKGVIDYNQTLKAKKLYKAFSLFILHFPVLFCISKVQYIRNEAPTVFPLCIYYDKTNKRKYNVRAMFSFCQEIDFLTFNIVLYFKKTALSLYRTLGRILQSGKFHVWDTRT